MRSLDAGNRTEHPTETESPHADVDTKYDFHADASEFDDDGIDGLTPVDTLPQHFVSLRSAEESEEGL